MAFAQIDGVSLHYRIDGDAGLPLLVLSNGLGLDLSMWDPQMAALTRSFRVLRYDTRGHGRSSHAALPISIGTLGHDVLALAEIAGRHTMHFCGLSMGGMIGIWLGIHAPNRLGKLVLAHTAAYIGPAAMWNSRIDTVLTHGMSAVSDAAMTRWFTPRFIAEQPIVVATLKSLMEQSAPQGYAACCAAVRDADFRSAIQDIEASALIITGLRDEATTPADGRTLASRIARSVLIELDAAHLSNIETPSLFSDTICEFLTKA